MIKVPLFPSKRIALYTAKLFLLRSLAVLAALVVILQTLDLLGESARSCATPATATRICGNIYRCAFPSWWRASCPSPCSSAP
jgi:hypothetical protein